ncbi:hypothetical protein H8F25_09560 [Synechococcus sp. CBW1004]|nr:hypothetical protein H8F25_09560 [Synechococcus sp. CBW1004]
MANDASRAMPPSSPPGSAGPLPRLPALPLAQAGLGLLGLFVIWSLVPILPPALMNPTWQRLATSRLVDNSPLVVLAVGLIHAAALLGPSDRRLEALRSRIVALLLPALIGYLLLIPLEIHATSRQFWQLDQQQKRQVAAMARTRGEAQQLIERAPDVASLEAGLRALQGPPLTPADRALPLAELKQRLRSSLEQSFQQLQNQVRPLSPGTFLAPWRQMARVVLTALLISVVLAALRFNSETERSLLEAGSSRLRKLFRDRALKAAIRKREAEKRRHQRQRDKLQRRR